jgi:hypothetical protein
MESMTGGATPSDALTIAYRGTPALMSTVLTWTPQPVIVAATGPDRRMPALFALSAIFLPSPWKTQPVR